MKNEDIWREADIERMTTLLRQRQLRWPHAKKGRGGYHQENDNFAGAGKRRRGGPRKYGSRDNIREDMKEYNMTDDLAQNKCGMEIKVGRVLYRGSLYSQ